MTLNEDLKKVKKVINSDGASFYFIGNDVINALPMLDLFDDLDIISYERSALAHEIRKTAARVHLLEEQYPQYYKLHTTNNLISHEFTEKVISNDEREKNLLVFKNSAAIEGEADRLGFKLLSAKASVSRRIESKINFYEALQDGDINLVPGEIIKMEQSSSYDDIAKKYGGMFVLQASKGFAGAKTYLVKNKVGFVTVKNAYLKRKMRLTKYLPGETITVNACATSLGIVVKPPFYQLTGIDELTVNKMGACGNDFCIKEMDITLRDTVIADTWKIGGMIYKMGYRGIFGVDYIVTGGKPCFIECNPRFVTSLPMFTQLELDTGEVPLVAFHVLECMGKMGEVHDIFDKAKKTIGKYSGSQLILHNLTDDMKKVKADFNCGVYRLKDGKPGFIRAGYSIDDVQSDDEFLLICKGRGQFVNPSMECARIMTGKRAFVAGGIDDDLKRLATALYEELL